MATATQKLIHNMLDVQYDSFNAEVIRNAKNQRRCGLVSVCSIPQLPKEILAPGPHRPVASQGKGVVCPTANGYYIDKTCHL